MSIIIDPLHLQHFKQNHQIEFENFFSEEAIKKVHKTLKKRAGDFPSEKPLPLKAGFDLWRHDGELKKILCSVKFAKMAGQLMDLSKLRFAFSQYLSSKVFCNEFAFLMRKSCIKDLLCGLCICLKPSENPENPFFATKKGNAIFFEMDSDFYLRFPKSEGKYLFIFYSTHKAHYSHQMQDPLNVFFRELGYEQGDRLKEDLNPSFSWMPL